ncbi:WD40 repeat-containing protein [Trypanosoma theileri]|uniref:WD40 repeat-containing protein n=1 Tax=Trypanosoma theileri TaxID=67003 RepID=A0A1X0NWV7_9TRYP|nr:WD40 repeat-containing protein [Trypanosoma theileri]ORC89091.1 WD40 repeat-containing protein [Trypanosoma theileri]
MLFVASDSKSQLIDLGTKTVYRAYSTSQLERHAVTYCSSSRMIVAHQSKGCTSFFSPSTQQPLQRSFTSEIITCSLCTHDGVFIFGGTINGNIYVWNTLSGELINLVRAHSRRVTDITISSDQSLIVTASEDSVCKVWFFAALVSRGVKIPAPRFVFNGHTLSVNACVFMETGYLVVTASSDRTSRIFDALTGQQQLVITVDDALTSVKTSPNDDVLILGSAVGSLFFVTLYGNASQSCLPTSLSRRDDNVVVRKSFEGGHSGAILFIWFDVARPEYAIVASENGVLLWWNTATRRAHNEVFPRLSDGLLSVCYVPKDAVSPPSTYPFSPSRSIAGLAKHPLDPSSALFSIVTVSDGEAAVKKHIITETAEVTSVSRRRQRQSDGNADNCNCKYDDNDRTETTDNRDSDEASSRKKRCLFEALCSLQQKNDELETLRDKLKRKLLRLNAS